MKSNKPRRVFTMREYRDNAPLCFKEAQPYGGFTVLGKEGTTALSVSSGPRGIICKVCNELPDWCENREECIESWKVRTSKAEKKLRSLADDLQEMALDVW